MNQEKNWSNSFGDEYTDRNEQPLKDMEAMTKSYYGLTQTELNRRFLPGMPLNARILEVGCNVGNQLLCLQTMGFSNLCGIDINSCAIEKAKQRTHGINLLKGSAFDLPFKDSFFDLIFTSMVLVHIKPDDLPLAMSEIYRCSKKYIWGIEYHSETPTEIQYRGMSDMLWRQNFIKLWLELFQLKVVKKEFLKYLDSDNVDVVYLLQKGVTDGKANFKTMGH